jgi:D-3-phosphoglycerate dehydrogenase
MGKQLKGATLGILGYGQIGQYLARLGVALGMRVLVNDPYKAVSDPGITQMRFGEVLAQSDFVVCLVVANDETENLMNAAAFARMKRGAYFINLSRGNLIDEKALEAALEAGQIAGAAMDVGRAADQKPSPFLAERPDVIATPHTAGLTPEAIEHQAFDTVNQVKALLAGEMPQGAANPEAARRIKWLAKRI